MMPSPDNSPEPARVIEVNPPHTGGTRKPVIPRGQIIQTEFSGPMPHPQLLKGYEDVCPGAADRMFRAVEAEAEHRRHMEKSVMEAQVRFHDKQFLEARMGQICALIISLAGIMAGTYTAINGHEWAGSAIGVGGIGGIVATFIAGRSRPSKTEDKTANQQQQNNRPNPKKRRK